MIKYIYIALGFLTLTIGLLGIVTPGLPTTPFILLTGFLFAKSSPRLHQKLKKNKITGAYLNRIEGGLSLRARLISICIMWCMVCFTAFVVFGYGRMRFVMIGLGVIGTFAQLYFLRKRKSKTIIVENKTDEQEITKP